MRIIVTLCCLFFAACQSADYHRRAVSNDEGNRVTVGRVQREIRVGMSGADVLGVLGSPNIVSTDDQRREVWVYDKIATEHAYSADSGGVAALILGGGPIGAGGMGGLGSGSYNRGAGASSTSQRTLTIIIKFDHGGRVRDFAYHTSSF